MSNLTQVPDPERGERASVFAASAWMVLISLLLFFLPLINGFVAGVVGGYKVGGVGRALVAALLPALVVAAVLWLIFFFFGAPDWGVLAGTTAAMLVIISDVGMFIGAAIGGALSNHAAPSH